MALLAEELVEEWLNRKGFFTIRGIRLGVHEIDLLAVRLSGTSPVECRHIEVQASMNPKSYISRVPVADQRRGVRANSILRSDEQMRVGVEEWVHKKYRTPKKVKLMRALYDGPWTSELVINEVTSETEVKLIESCGVTIHRLAAILREMEEKENPIKSAASADFFNLIRMGDRIG